MSLSRACLTGKIADRYRLLQTVPIRNNASRPGR